jgi:hypothetical protein
MVVILVEQEPSDEMSRAEVMTITAATITRLDNDELFEHNTIPVSTDLTYLSRYVSKANTNHNLGHGCHNIRSNESAGNRSPFQPASSSDQENSTV